MQSIYAVVAGFLVFVIDRIIQIILFNQIKNQGKLVLGLSARPGLFYRAILLLFIIAITVPLVLFAGFSIMQYLIVTAVWLLISAGHILIRYPKAAGRLPAALAIKALMIMNSWLAVEMFLKQGLLAKLFASMNVLYSFHNISVISSFILSLPIAAAGLYASIKSVRSLDRQHSMAGVAVFAGALLSFILLALGLGITALSFYAVGQPLRAGIIWNLIVIGIAIFLYKGADTGIVIWIGLLVYFLCGCGLIATGIFY